MDQEYLTKVAQEEPFLAVVINSGKEAAAGVGDRVAWARRQAEGLKSEIESDLAAHKVLAGDIRAAAAARNAKRLREIRATMRGLEQRIEKRRSDLKSVQEVIGETEPFLERLRADLVRGCRIVYPRQMAAAGFGETDRRASPAAGDRGEAVSAPIAMTVMGGPVRNEAPVTTTGARAAFTVVPSGQGQDDGAGAKDEEASAGDREIEALLSDIAESSKAIEGGLSEALELLEGLSQRFGGIEEQLGELNRGLQELADRRDEVLHASDELEEAKRAAKSTPKSNGWRERAGKAVRDAKDWLMERFGPEADERIVPVLAEAGRMHGPSFKENFDERFSGADAAGIARRFVRNPGKHGEDGAFEKGDEGHDGR